MFDPCFQIIHLTKSLLIWIDRRYLLSNTMKHRLWRDAATRKNLSIHPHLNTVRGENSRLDRFIQTFVQCISYHTDHLHPIIRIWSGQQVRRSAAQAWHFKRTAQHIPVWIVTSCEFLIHQYQQSTVCDLSGVPNAAFEERNMQRAEITRIDEFNSGGLRFR